MVFIGIVFIVVCIFMVYDLIKPIQKTRKPTALFPTIKPSDIPSMNKTTNSCYYHPEPCDGDGVDACRACGDSSEFECLEVLDGENVVINGTQLKPGKWCVPKHQGDKKCNPYTGTWTWEESEQCPSGGQCWRCVCQFPDIFGNSPDGCTSQQACSIGGKEYPLHLTQEGSAELKLKGVNVDVGTVYNPSYDVKSTDPNYILFMDSVSPYSTTKDGKPYFKCDCKDKDVVQIDPDYYNCHPFPCYPGTTKTDANWSQNQCICNPLGKVPRGDLKGTCFDPKLCNINSGSYDAAKGECTFTGGATENGGFVARACSSNHVKIDGAPNCADPNNPIGSEIVDMCADIRNSESFKQYGASLSWNGSNCVSTCKPDGTGYKNAKIRTGAKCDRACYPRGVLQEQCFGGGGFPPPPPDCHSNFGKQECCSGNTYSNTGGTFCS